MSLTSREQDLAASIAGRAGALLDDLRLHVAIPTGGNNTEALDQTRERLVARCRALGAQEELLQGDPKPDWLMETQPAGPIPPSVACRRTAGKPGPRVLVAGHLDTVHDPHGPFRELSIAPDGATATGPGCVDMKGGLVIAIHALEALDEAGVDTSWTFFLNSDEETGTFHSERALQAEARAHDLGIALEPALADGALAIARMGSGQFMVQCRGKSAHVGREFTKGVSAVTALARTIVRIADMADPEKGRIINIGPLAGGAVTNAVPDFARAWGNARFMTQEAGDELGAMLDALGTPADAMPRVEMFRAFSRPAKPLTPATKSLALGARAVAEDLGQSLPFAETGGVCDGNTMQAAGLPTIDTLGVRGGGLHTRDEWIDLSSLVQRCQLLAVLLHRIADGRAGADTPAKE